MNKQINLNYDNHFSAEKYPIYDNYAAWNVDKLTDIPIDTEIETTLSADRYEEFKYTYGDDCELLSVSDNEYHVKIHYPIWGVPVTFVERVSPSNSLKLRDLIVGHKCDITIRAERERERERDKILPITHSKFSGMNTNCSEAKILSGNLKSMDKEYINEFFVVGRGIKSSALQKKMA